MVIPTMGRDMHSPLSNHDCGLQIAEYLVGSFEFRTLISISELVTPNYLFL